MRNHCELEEFIKYDLTRYGCHRPKINTERFKNTFVNRLVNNNSDNSFVIKVDAKTSRRFEKSR